MIKGKKKETLSPIKDTGKNVSKAETRPQYKNKAGERVQPKLWLLKYLEPRGSIKIIHAAKMLRIRGCMQMPGE